MLPKTFDVPCRVVDAEASTESSLAENIIRQAMHPADQFMAFQQLVSDGLGFEEIAARFGVTATTVRTAQARQCRTAIVRTVIVQTMRINLIS